MTIVALLTDFGMSDSYAGVMKGVILGIAPETVLIDISHDIPPQDIRAGAFVLKSASPYFPLGTIVVAIVDPGVGSERRIIAVRTSRALFIAPDNGVLSWALHGEDVQEIVSVTESRYWLPKVSRTFHGRDIFAPVAAHLANGLPIDRLGRPIQDPIHLPLPRPRLETGGVVHGEVIYIDRFGNLVTDIQLDPGDHRITNLSGCERDVHLNSAIRVQIREHRINSIRDDYADGEPGEMLALVGSSGHLEVAVCNGNAALLLGGTVGMPVRVTLSLGASQTSAHHITI